MNESGDDRESCGKNQAKLMPYLLLWRWFTAIGGTNKDEW